MAALGGIARLLDDDRTAWVAGVALPVAMVILDPAVFRCRVPEVGAAFLGAYKPFGYVAIGLGVLAVALHLCSRRRSALLAGSLAGAALFAFALGAVLLPFSFFGTVFFFGVGLLGLTPFVSSAAVAWRSRRAYRDALEPRKPLRFIAGFVLFLAVCVGVQSYASLVFSAGLVDIATGSPQAARLAFTRIAHLRGLLDLDHMVIVWSHEQDSGKKERLADAYLRLTGSNIQDKANAMVD